MYGRPSSSRPSTSARPTTAFDRDQFQYHLQQHQPHEIEEESEEESDDEDVFAFLPPTTADQERQPTSQSPSTFASVPYPEPTFDPWGRQYPISPVAARPLPPGIHGTPYQTHPTPHLYNKPPISPPSPSTDSRPSTGMTGPDFYRLKKLGKAALSKLGVGVVDNVKQTEKDTDKEKYPRDTSNLEQDTSLHSESLAAISPSKGITEGIVSVLRERGTKNPNALPYKMYSQQASSYYGRDLRTGSASASGVGMSIPLLLSYTLLPSNQSSIPASQNARLSSTQSSSFQQGAGPSHSHSQYNSQSLSQTYHQYRQQQHHPGTGVLGMPQASSSVADSLSMTQSMMEDSEGRSIK